ncbi:MAG: hypothetical protein ACKOW9_03745 [Candidatus Paceibacterota bacterium]
MERSRIKNTKKNGGQAMITSVVFFLFLSLTVIAGLVSPTVRDYTSGRLNFDSKRVYYLTESGAEDYLYRVFNAIPISTTEVLALDGSSVSTTLHSDTEDLYIRSDGNMKTLNRILKVAFDTNQTAAFNYGLQVGEGGVTLTGSDILGNVFSNGPIYGDSSSNITGTAISANNNALTQVAGHGAGGIPVFAVDFGNVTLGQDSAQSFQATASGAVSSVQLYLKRSNTVDFPGNVTIRIVSDNSGVPSSTTLASGSLLAANVDINYTWIDIPLTGSPFLNSGTRYWIVVDVAFVAPATPYYTWGATREENPYVSGIGLVGRHSDYWTTYVFSFDYQFKVFTTGSTGLIAGSSGSQWNPLRIGTVSGTAQANTVNYVNVTGTLYCQNGTGNNKSCTSQADPTPQSFPIPDAYIDGWKAVAENGGTHNGNYSVGLAGATLGPQKINGDLNISSGGTLTVTGTLWVTGNITLSGNGRIVLSSSYGQYDGVIVNDGTITIGSSSSVGGSGVSGSYMMMLTTSNSVSAINISGGSGAVILYAANGTLNISGGATVNSATAYRILVSGGSDLVYESGLANVEFSSGVSAPVSISIGDWNEIQ